MRTAILGGGAMGSLFGGHLAAAGVDATLVDASSAHVEAAREGLRVERPGEPTLAVPVEATTDPATVGRVDLLIVSVKSYDTADALAGARSLVEGAATVLTLQNGLGNAETLAEFVPEGDVLAGTTAHGATFLEPGRVRHAGRGPTRVGRAFGPTDDRTRAVAAHLDDAGFEAEVVEDVRDAVWEKVLVNVGINAATALARVENGALADTAPGRRLVERAVAEAARVARAEGRAVPESPAERALDVARATARNVSSMRRDVESGDRTEVEALHGAVVARGEELGVETPVNRTLADLVRLAERAGDQARGSDGRGQS